MHRPNRSLACATVLAVAVSGLAGCVSTPQPLRGEWSALQPHAAVDTDLGQRVRWGGRVVEVRPGAEATCFDLIAQPLAANAAPAGGDLSLGRFRACRAGFYDPALFAPNREMTFTGRLAGFDTARIGEREVRLPRLDAEVVFLWPQRREVDVVVVERSPWW
ncbi:Slp family lipoprotein [Silanimonas sp.]|uniref:Slp family lipoprotein n=1 Tax=Silanimonas sp. TaxID=1929290 RepID=UPI001BC6AD38|nr:Slp family lipoprotein [Silanimonas sp.]MBS3895583.1 Slp family lipoprotein [Silanimonas sp.]MBS3924334.1 Slp family lipoprotein [Xanthomonadaceae bacterium]